WKPVCLHAYAVAGGNTELQPMLQPLSRAGAAEPLPPPTETGLLGAFQLKRAWARQRARRQGVFDGDQRDFHLDQLVFDALGIGLEQTIQHLGRSALSFEEFERWIVATTGGVSELQVARINAAIAGTEYPATIKQWLASVDSAEPVLSADDLAFWDEHGYVVVHDAVPAETREAATQAILHHLGARLDDPESWYRHDRRSIMVQ